MKQIIAAMIIAICLTGCAGPKDRLPSLKGQRVAMVVARHQFRDEELFRPREMLRQAGAEILVASSTLEEIHGMLGMSAQPDILVDRLKAMDFDALIFVGGAGAQEFWADSTALLLAKTAADSGKVLGAICIAPITLARAGVLSGKKATVWPSLRGQLEEAGAIYTGADVQVDDRLVTANGPDAAEEFSRRIAQLLAR
jgi:protease I